MSDFGAFLKQNRPAQKNEFMEVCADIKDQNGKVIPWELRHLTPGEISKMKSICYKIKKKGKDIQFDGDLYNRLITSRAVVFPDLKNQELVDSYMEQYAFTDRTPENLITLIIRNNREFEALLLKVCEMNGLIPDATKKEDEDGDDDGDTTPEIETAKN